ncbi:ABC transporter substrate-binding protein [Variovorax sp. J22P168]|uniref:ABC transporter substrate-binding protein n=1 Tax=Variovorax jilinensis TaxID=3053513 RepID=UPI002577FCA1|nr:ABC transporter substrate-binding protein [Variovorax sp. J22P168]MDM0015873.1 ABC transporter substrate-binding protein [Variovorax sp. J22P168]
MPTPASALPRIGILSGWGPDVTKPVVNELARIGWVHGRTAIIVERFSTGSLDELPQLARELVQAKVDVIMAFTSTAAVAVQSATKTIPTVVLGAHDGVADGLFQSLARPGGNMTGSETLSPFLDEKRAELLRLIVPKAVNVAVIFNPRNPSSERHLKSTGDVARKLGMNITLVPVEAPKDFPAGFAAMDRSDLDAAFSYTDEVVWLMPRFEYQKARRLPMVCEYEVQVKAGCLFSYGALYSEFTKVTAQQIDKILKGARPAEMPVHIMTRYELVLNRTTARALNLDIPHEFSHRADRILD